MLFNTFEDVFINLFYLSLKDFILRDFFNNCSLFYVSFSSEERVYDLD